MCTIDRVDASSQLGTKRKERKRTKRINTLRLLRRRCNALVQAAMNEREEQLSERETRDLCTTDT